MQSRETQFKHLPLEKPIRITEQVWLEGTVPVVSICCITYQHVDFIRDAIEGFLIQETTFPVEIIIHDDASTDGTAEIILKYQEKYPQLVRAILQKENQYSQGKSPGIIARSMARGEFIALCEGDDYWTVNNKLEKQVDFLRTQSDAVGVFHRGYAVDEIKKRIIFVWDSIKYESSYSQKECIFTLLSGYPTAALVFRKKAYPALGRFPSYFKKEPCDFCSDIMITENGKLGFLDFEGSAYRQHAGGIWSGLTRAQMHKKMVDRYSELLLCNSLNEKYPELKPKVLRLMDVQWWLYFESGLKSWFLSTIQIIWQQRRLGAWIIFYWMFRSQSPVRYKLRDIICAK